MTTLYGGARPDDFEDDDVLTAELFKQATGFWVVDDVPSDAEGNNGDVVFVLKEEELGAGGGGSGSSAPGAAVIDSATLDDGNAIVATSFVGDGTNGDDGQAYDVYEFLGSGTLNVTEPGMVDALIVAGGGGSGYNCGGGGAGGVLLSNNIYLEAPGLVVVGAGGLEGIATYFQHDGLNGGESRLNTHTALGGGAGATKRGNPGGSGGGGGVASDGQQIIGGAGSYQGNDGGFGVYGGGGHWASGGGGGSKTAGADYDAGAGGDGGDGDDYSSFIGEVAGTLILAGGGGGSSTHPSGQPAGNGGAGGGGAGDVGQDGAQNTGSGGGSGFNRNGGKGGSGRVFVRVKVPTTSFAARSAATTPKTAHAARVENGVVRQVITIPHLNDDDNKITEYCNKIGLPGTWVDTSYTGARRGKYAGVGDLFDPSLRNAEFTTPVVEEELTK